MTDSNTPLPQQYTDKLGHSANFIRKRNFLMSAPILVYPFLCMVFYGVGGGRNTEKTLKPPSGLNTQLPRARTNQPQKEENKLGVYEKADADSARRKAYLQNDPYRSNGQPADSNATHSTTLPATPSATYVAPEDPRANELLKKLEQLNQNIRNGSSTPHSSSYYPVTGAPLTPNEEKDPQLEKLNGMLDKIIRIQHPNRVDPVVSSNDKDRNTIDTSVNSLPGIVAEDQVLVAGATIELRLSAPASFNGIPLPKDQLVYGIVSINNDRMLIHINSIRYNQAIYPIGLEVYDLDGLPGIHIPGSLGRETAKQSADQSINDVNITNYDPSLGAQAASASIQTARTLLSRKVRLIRVAVHAGYQVLLRNTHTGSSIRVVAAPHPTSDTTFTLPSPALLWPFLDQHARSEKIDLLLQGIYLLSDHLIFSLQLTNNSPISFTPDYIRWFIRNKRLEKRTAIQDIPLYPVAMSSLSSIPGDSSRLLLAGFISFALSKEKELVLQIADKGGARLLSLSIDHKTLLKAQTWDTGKKQKTVEPSSSTLQ